MYVHFRVFINMISAPNVIQERVKPGQVRPGRCAESRFSFGYQHLHQYRVKDERLLISVMYLFADWNR